jgi:hypothetical protein
MWDFATKLKKMYLITNTIKIQFHIHVVTSIYLTQFNDRSHQSSNTRIHFGQSYSLFESVWFEKNVIVKRQQ